MQSASQEDVIAAAVAALGPHAAEALESETFNWEALLPGAVLWDSSGRIPGTPGYITTWDSDWLAGLAASQFAAWDLASSQTTKLQVDGDSIEVSPPSWGAMANTLFSRSPIYRYAASFAGALGSIQVDLVGPRLRPTSSQV